MITIVVTPGGRLSAALYSVLSRKFEVLSVREGEILLPDISPDILLTEHSAPPECDGEVIYILGAVRGEAERPPFSPNPRAVAVVNAQNAEALSFAARHHLRVLTCGLSGKDTLTLSSIMDGSAAVCLLREIETIGGGIMEPAEIPVKLVMPLERCELLFLAAAVLLCGAEELLLGGV